MRIASIKTRLVSLGATAALVATGLVVTTLVAPSASAAISPDIPVVQAPTASTVTADALPTVQIDGVVWDQDIVGNTVYVGGQFTNARPAGAAPGTSLTSRSNLLAYNLSTGTLISSFNPSLNGSVNAIATSPDGTKLYVAGSFTKVGTVTKNRIAAFNVATGALITTFTASLDYTVKALVATDSAVYVGGAFSKANGVSRPRLAAFNPTTGALLAWAPTADATVNALTMTPNGASVIAGGSFQNVNANAAFGLAKIAVANAALQPWNTTNVIRNAGSTAAILSLSTDGTAIYGSGYTFGPGTLEGVFSANPDTGDLNWVEDCHGDTYDHWVGNGVLYTVSHDHYCGNLGGFPQSDPWSINMRHALAFTAYATGTLGNDPLGYYNYGGIPGPSMINWFPDLAVGTFTGKTQAAWSVTGNSEYVLLGGEFPSVNGVAQQGLVRFAVPSLAPKKIAPDYSGADFNPTITGLPSGSARVAWQANSDRDDHTLTYTLTRNNVVVYTKDADSTFWNRPTMGFIDSSVVPGTLYKYRLTATDNSGNTAQSQTVNFTAPAAGSTNAYAQRVVADGASTYWPMNETTGTVLLDNAGFNDADTAATGVTRGTSGAITGDAATTFDGTTTASTRVAIAGPNTYTAQAWIKTTTTSGGKILGFGASQTGNSGSYDRHIYMDNAGHIYYGVYPNGVATLNSAGSYNDGQWHQITATLGADGMKLYIDDKLIGQRGDVTFGQAYSGFWRVGGDNIGGWPNQPASNNFAGTIDEVAIYPTVLSRQTIDAQWVASGRTSTVPAAPADAYGAAVFNDNPLLYWRLGESTGSTAADSGPAGDQTGVYENGVIQGAAGGIKGTTNTAAGFDGADDIVASTNTYANPTNYSEEAWFKTTSQTGGKIIGFGNAQNGQSNNYDRHVYMNNDGKVSFGVWTGQENLATTPNALNDGQWHHVVATQSTTDGMKLYVDGALAGTNPQTGSQEYTGYWRIGGDSRWGSGTAFLAGTIDDVAVYNSVLSPAQVANHFNLGNTAAAPVNQLPTADFASTATFLAASFTSNASDPDGTIASYEWNFGDGSPVSIDPNATHTYSSADTYNVSLKVTDNSGGTFTVTHPITVTAPAVNQLPTASFTAMPDQLTVNLDGSASSDSDGTIANWSWNFGPGEGTGTGQTTSHTFTTAGMKTITLTVTDNQGGTGTSAPQQVQVIAPPANVLPTANFTVGTSGLTANLESTSSDPDGTIASYAWDFGNGVTDTTPSVVHPFAAAGTFPVTLTVKDNSGGSSSITKNVTVTTPPPANAAPTAAFSFTTNSLQASLNGSASSDDGTITNFSWDFGDGKTDINSTATVNHTYLASGTYKVTLTVTDNGGLTNAVTQDVAVSTPSATPLINDAFGRTTANGWGTADVGGAWTAAGGVANFSVNGGTGKIKMATAGSGPSVTSRALGTADTNATVDISLDKPVTGGGIYVSLASRKIGNSEYRTTAKFLVGGSVQLQVVKIASGVSTTLRTVTVPGLTYNAGDVVTLRFQVSGTSSVALNAKVWKTGTAEPAAFQSTATDSSAPLTTAGSIALYPYLSGSSTNAPVVATFDNLTVFAVTP